MSNSKLLGKIFPVPDKILLLLGKNLKKFSDKRDYKGFNRAIFILERRACTYEQLKRIKNYFDSVTDENFNEIEYLLNGGEEMRNWVNYTLDQARKSVHTSKSVKSKSGMSNQFRSEENGDLTPKAPTIRSTPDFMSTSELMEEINKINEINIKLN